jgi:hypothetical protein
MLTEQLCELNQWLPEDVSRLRQHLPTEQIEQCLQATNKATLRRRRLPAEQVVWLTIGMALFRRSSISEVLHTLDLALEGQKVTVARSAIPKARGRVGPEPLQWLFERTAGQWAHTMARQQAWRGLALYAIDGTLLSTPDTTSNECAFGRHRSGKKRTPAAYPQLRLVSLMAVRPRLLAGAVFGALSTAELTMAQNHLIPEIPDYSLTVVDRLYANSPTLLPLLEDGCQRHFLTRLKSNAKWEKLQELGEGDFLVRVPVNGDARQANPQMPRSYDARVLTYGQGYLLTSLTDGEQFPADEVRAMYHERWEIELGYDELKTDVLQQQPTLRSKSAPAIAQEVWALLLAYNLVRYEMAHVAAEAKVSPNRISFVMALSLICTEWQCSAATPGAIPKRLQQLRAQVSHFVLPKRKSHRRFPRAVKRKESSYPRKKPREMIPESPK